MFKLVERKAFFYFSVFLSVACALFSVNYINPGPVDMVKILFTCVIEASMMVFFNRDNKELMKVLLASFITIVFITTLSESCEVIFNFLMRIDQYGMRYPQDQIRTLILSGSLIAIPVLILLLFINHLIINFNGEASNVIINVNKAIVLILVIYVIIDKFSVSILNVINGNEMITMPSKLRLAIILRDIHVIFDVFAIVSAEAFINAKRAEKAKSKAKSNTKAKRK